MYIYGYVCGVRDRTLFVCVCWVCVFPCVCGFNVVAFADMCVVVCVVFVCVCACVLLCECVCL